MYTIKRKVKRPNTSLEFRNMLHESVTIEVRTHWVTNYKDTKCMLVDTELSSDGLEMSTTMIWDSKDSWNEYQNDHHWKSYVLIRKFGHSPIETLNNILQQK